MAGVLSDFGLIVEDLLKMVCIRFTLHQKVRNSQLEIKYVWGFV
jgi:hypothetical protein